jgi:hypothetical protein
MSELKFYPRFSDRRVLADGDEPGVKLRKAKP